MTSLAHKSGGLVHKSSGLGTSCGCCQQGLCKRRETEPLDNLFSTTECSITDTVTTGIQVLYSFAYAFTNCGWAVADCPFLFRHQFTLTKAAFTYVPAGCRAANSTFDSASGNWPTLNICQPSCSSGNSDCNPLCDGNSFFQVVERCAGQTGNLDYSVTFTLRRRL